MRTGRARVAIALTVAALLATALPALLRDGSVSARAAAHVPRARNAPSSVVRIGVLGLFHPRQLTVRATAGAALVVQAGEQTVVLERSSGMDTAQVRISADEMMLSAGTRVVRASTITIAGRAGEPADFVLSIPGKIARRYHGTLELRRSGQHLLVTVTMDRELAVASVVAAESTADTPFEAMKAQAIAARSYLIAGGRRHHDFDFCDTTHCQFLRQPPGPGSAAFKAVETTRDLVLVYEDRPFAAMYTRSCSGRTHTPAELGLPAASYPYYPVDCKYCRSHPARWSSRISAREAASLHNSDEKSRLDAARQFGWDVVPSNDFVTTEEGADSVLEGIGQGHGIGLCQAGAKAMAAEGADVRQILSHYYPNTAIVSLQNALPL